MNTNQCRHEFLVARAVPFGMLALVRVVGGALALWYPLRAAEVSPGPEKPFQGTIAINAKDSSPDWQGPVTAPSGAPNILLIMLDDVGFADTSTFGGMAQTPVLDQLAREGLRYNRFHTSAICSPTRAALLSGRNPHRVGYGSFGGSGYPGYDGIWKKRTASVPEILRRNGYNTSMFGKWHNTPYREMSPMGPFDRWPTGLGFDYFYGCLLGASSQWEPQLWRNTEMVMPSAKPSEGYHFTTDITDEAIRWIRLHAAVAPDKPYFVYYSPEAAHLPHHVPPEWIAKYHGQFDSGWDKLREQIFVRQKKLGVTPADAELTPRPGELPAWDSLSADQKQVLARQMEVYAAFIEHTDHEVGRLIQAVKESPAADNTLILFIVGDNGSEPIGGIYGQADLTARRTNTSENIQHQLGHLEDLGGPLHDNTYAAAWAWLGSTPFQWVKHVASHFGATRNPMVISWPARIKNPGGVRSQFSYVTDIAPTLFEAAGIPFPEVVDGVQQLSLDGVSLVETFERPDAPDPHRVQYFEAEGNRAIYHDGWMASARHFVPWVASKENTSIAPNPSDFTQGRWELYHVATDFSQARDVAAQHPEKLSELKVLFDAEARRNDVYPLGAGTGSHLFAQVKADRKVVLYPDFPPMLASNLPNFSSSFRVRAQLEVPASGANGVILARGNRGKGAVLFVKDNRVVYENHVPNKPPEILGSRESLPPGRVDIVLEIEAGAAKDTVGRLYINGRLVQTATLSPNPSGFDHVLEVGRNSLSPVSQAYEMPFSFSGTIKHVIIEPM